MKLIKSSLVLLLWLILPGLGQAQDVKTFTIGEELDWLYSIVETVDADNDMFDNSTNELRNNLHDAVKKYIWHYLSGFNDNPQPDDLKAYFAKLQEDMVAVAYWNYDGASPTADADRQGLIKEFDKAISCLQAYVDGRTDKYPAKLLKDELDSILGTAWMINSEGDWYELWAFAAYRLLQQMVRFCPDISLIADFVTKDGRVGIYDVRMHEYVYRPCFSPVFIRGNDGQWRVYIHDMFMPTRAYCVWHDGPKVGYLLSKHGVVIGHDVDASFYARYFETNDEYTYCHAIENQDYLEDFNLEINRTSEEIVIFDSDNIVWKICVPKGGYYHQVPGTPVLKMIFEDGDPLFLLEGEN